LNAGTGGPRDTGEAEGALQSSLLAGADPGALKETVEGILRKHGVRYTIEWYVSGEPFYTSPVSYLMRWDRRSSR